MEIASLSINRRPSYDEDYPNMMVGVVQMKGAEGKMEVKLSNLTVANIFSLIKTDVKRVAKQNANQAEHAVSQAENEFHAIEAPKVD